MRFAVHKKGIFTTISGVSATAGYLGEIYISDILALSAGLVFLYAKHGLGMPNALYRPLDLVWRLVLCLPIFDGFVDGLFAESAPNDNPSVLNGMLDGFFDDPTDSSPQKQSSKREKGMATIARITTLLVWF